MITDIIDTAILNELYQERVDLLLTEDRALHHKARVLGIADRVHTMADAFLEKVVAENSRAYRLQCSVGKKEPLRQY